MKLRENPLEEILKREGAVLEPCADFVGKKGSLRVMNFGDARAEYQALRQGAGLIDTTAHSTLVATGPDRATWLHGLCTQEIKKLQPWQGAYACHIDIKGRVIADFEVFTLEDMLILHLAPGAGRMLRRALRRYIVMEKVKIEERTETTASLEVVGPRSAPLLARLLGAPAVESLAMHHGAPVHFEGLDLLVVATQRLGVPGLRLICARDEVAALWTALRRDAGDLLVPCGLEACQSLRLSQGKPAFGAELQESVLFNEVELTEAVSFTKGCYLGQEVVERVDARGRLGRRLMGLRIEADTAPLQGAKVLGQTRSLGNLTSVALSDKPGVVWAMGLLHRSGNAPGSKVQISVSAEQQVEATIVERLEMQ